MKPSKTRKRDQFDSPWKEILEAYFQEFMHFFFPDIEKEIDWAKGYESLDKELHQIAREAETGKRIADKLMKVWRKNGEETWVLAHTEIQGGEEKRLPRRVFVYNYRGHELYERPVVSLVILADDNPAWRVSEYHQELWGCKTCFSFPTVKLLDYKDRREYLETSSNPFAVVVMAHFKTIETQKDENRRLQYKLAMSKRLYEFGWSKDDIIKLYRFIDWIMTLPDRLEQEYHQKLMAYEREVNMQYVSSAERIGMEKGIAKGIEKGIEKGREEGLRKGILKSLQTILKIKFGEQGAAVYSKIHRIKKIDRLEKILESVESAATPEDVLYAALNESKK